MFAARLSQKIILLVLSLNLIINLPVGILMSQAGATSASLATTENYVWTERYPTTLPQARTAPLMAYDPRSEKILMFGGYVGGSAIRVNDTWTWDGENWEQLHPTVTPPARSGGGMAYDPISNRIIMYGGDGRTNFLGDTWTWTGTDWQELTPSASPGLRGVPYMATDEKNDNIVFFGGQSQTGPTNETWVWDGGNWVQQAPSTSPTPRAFGQMAYDPANQNLVMFGGNSSGGFLNDTWTWDGVDWTQHITTSAPNIRMAYGLAYDGAHIILFGGEILGSGGRMNDDTWFWSGTDWSQQPLVTNKRGHVAMVYDPKHDQLFSFGGYSEVMGSIINETWTLQSAPIVATGNVNTLTSSYAELSGEVVIQGKNPVTERGIEVYDSNSHAIRYASTAGGAGNYTIRAANLAPDANYSYRAYAIDRYGITYASEMKGFRTPTKPPITLDSSSYNLQLNETHQTVVTGVYEEDNSSYVITSGVTFSSSEPQIASVNTDGLVTGLAEGTSVITAVYNGMYAAAIVNVLYSPPVVTNLSVDNASYNLLKGDTQQTVTQAVYEDGSRKVVSEGVTYTSSNPNVATINEHGLITAVSKGSTVITIEYAGKSIDIVVNVRTRSSNDDNNSGSGDNGGGGGGTNNSSPGTTDDQSSSSDHDASEVKDEVTGDTIASTTVQNENGEQVTVVQVDSDKAISVLEKTGRNKLVINSASENTVRTQLDAKLTQWLEQQDGSIEINAGQGSTILQARQLHTDRIADQYGGAATELQSLHYSITVSGDNTAQMQAIEQAAAARNLTLVGTAIHFAVTAEYQGVQITVPDFEEYAKSLILLPAGYDPNRITTGIVYDESQVSFMHVPTKVIQLNGRYYAQINSLLSSGTYALIWNEEGFADTVNHWANGAIVNMASRLVIEGTSASSFEPNREITRAEFATIAVRAFGLQDQSRVGQTFSDVNQNAWYQNYVNTASAYGLLTGYDDGSFKPNRNISREEAVAILIRAVKLAHVDTTANSLSELESYKDGDLVSSWASASVGFAVQQGIVQGDQAGMLNSQSPVSRAETAALIERILKFASLI
ncbi:S-layer homology domain-containing protein [Paenibacillus massiliensis]|uniref:S-layer homology domain-containing protein n=1 Tax=Paenibacillus massiliensis TaxID=225917 RepID=UPI00048DEB57|nr:S-layer homology domain-containing protein [Paenibacillus massiliensis]